MIREFLNLKYGKYVTDKLLTTDNRVLIDKINKDGLEDQKEVLKHITNLKDIDGNKLLPDKFLSKKIEWGVDFSSWLGTLEQKKDFLFIGAEPHVDNNYQLVYDFGSHINKTIEDSAMEHFLRSNDIWSYLTKIFVSDLTPINITGFLCRCYITDLSHIVPKRCGQVNVICNTLEIEEKEWYGFRTSVAKTFLPLEIKAVNPKYIILHGNASRHFFQDTLGIKYESSITIEGTRNLRVLSGHFNGFRVISIPHLKGDMRNKLWKCKKDPRRPESVKKILNDLINCD